VLHAAKWWDLYAYPLVNPSDEQALGRGVHTTPAHTWRGDRGWVNIRAAVTVAKQKSTGSLAFGDLEDYDVPQKPFSWCVLQWRLGTVVPSAFGCRLPYNR
jgi:hypothetical protein